MKAYHLLFAFILCCLTACNTEQHATSSSSKTIRVAVFDGHGGAQSCIWETLAALKLDPEMDVRSITTADIAHGVLDSIDAIVIPGGGGSRQYLNLGNENQKRIKNFIEQGGGAVGICAGAYLFSNTPGYASMQLNGAQAIDIEHDNRGHGIAKFTLTEQGKELFPELNERDTLFVMYYEGPVFVRNQEDSIQYESFATMQSDVHEEGNAPTNMTNDKPFYIANEYGKGRVFSSIAHPEATPGMMWMIPRMVRWTLHKPYITYKKEVMNPELFDRELLMSVADLKQEASYFETFLYGSPSEKLEALNWLEEKHSWDAKRWLQGLLFDGDSAVRLRAARYIANTQYLHYLPELRAAHQAEQDQRIKHEMGIALKDLESLLP